MAYNYNNPSTKQIPFVLEWNCLLGEHINLEKIENYCLKGRLRDSRLRAVIWRILLNVLPLERQEWVRILNQSRSNYSRFKTKLDVDPRAKDPVVGSLDPLFSNPLSVQNDNPWQQYFEDSALKDCIQKDVERTFPELEFFQNKTSQKIMADILFVYAKKNEHVSYRQGMHEILAPILFVLYFESQSFAHLAEQPIFLRDLTPSDIFILQQLNNIEYLEHDAFCLFEQLMMLIERWYDTEHMTAGGEETRNGNCNSAAVGFASAPKKTLFSEFDSVLFEEKENRSELLRKIDYIHRELLPQLDPDLSAHLRALEIAPQIYGIRWLRLLFGREFPLHDLLFLWDAILASASTDRSTSNNLALVDYIFVALLTQIRDLLLESDYTSCIQYLMRYPPIFDIQSFLNHVLYLKSPKKYPRPETTTNKNHFSQITQAGTQHPNFERQKQRLINNNKEILAQHLKDGTPKKSVGKNVLNKLGKPGGFFNYTNNSPNFLQNSMSSAGNSPQKLPLFRNNKVVELPKSNSVFYTDKPQNSTTYSTPSGLDGSTTNNNIELLKDQVAELQQRLSTMNETVEIAAERLLICCDHLYDLKVDLPILNSAETVSNKSNRNENISNNNETVSNRHGSISMQDGSTSNLSKIIPKTEPEIHLAKSEAEFQKHIILNELKQVAEQLLNSQQNRVFKKCPSNNDSSTPPTITPKIRIESGKIKDSERFTNSIKDKVLNPETTVKIPNSNNQNFNLNVANPQRRKSESFQSNRLQTPPASHKQQSTTYQDEWNDTEEMEARVRARTLSRSLKANNELIEMRFDRRKLF